MARARRQAGTGDRKRPLRRSQMISPFGVGAISDFRGDESLMCAGPGRVVRPGLGHSRLPEAGGAAARASARQAVLRQATRGGG